MNKHWRGVASAASRIGWHQQHLRCGLLRFRPDGRVLLFRQKDETICADVRPPLRGGSFAPVPWWGDAPTGHPWPNGARSASMPSAPHPDTCAQPPDARLAASARTWHVKANIKSRAGRRLLERGLPANQAPRGGRLTALAFFAGKPRSRSNRYISICYPRAAGCNPTRIYGAMRLSFVGDWCATLQKNKRDQRCACRITRLCQ